MIIKEVHKELVNLGVPHVSIDVSNYHVNVSMDPVFCQNSFITDSRELASGSKIPKNVHFSTPWIHGQVSMEFRHDNGNFYTCSWIHFYATL